MKYGNRKWLRDAGLMFAIAAIGTAVMWVILDLGYKAIDMELSSRSAAYVDSLVWAEKCGRPE